MNATLPSSPAGATAFGAALKTARMARRRSQLDLALAADLSQRHLSFLESGRARPSRAALLRLADALDLGLATRNALLTAAGFAPVYERRTIDALDMAPIRDALGRMLRHHEPFPAMVIDRRWNLVMANEATQRFISLLGPPDEVWRRICPDGARNMVKLSFHPQGLRPLIVNFDDIAAALLSRLGAEAQDFPEVAALREEVLAFPGSHPRWRSIEPGSRPQPVLATHFRVGDVDLRMFAMITHFDMPQDLTTEDLRVETLYPADAASEQLLHALAGTAPRPA